MLTLSPLFIYHLSQTRVRSRGNKKFAKINSYGASCLILDSSNSKQGKGKARQGKLRQGRHCTAPILEDRHFKLPPLPRSTLHHYTAKHFFFG
jgi:hypothetical protein